ncbi:hypothetical protein JD522_07635 [Aeromonas hydrophila]|uniref:winged helix-turn-helix domain-containing protein n=1 Tax=Aeromonas TaxID=642 RepID=UPI00191CEAFB|nr:MULTISPECIES: hypothetical protein [Aeromonas]MBL0573291.1 hypothetical protein [Aeromonas hydrophila]MDI3430277.1 hypothetical protein [Aeromonas sp. V90_14]
MDQTHINTFKYNHHTGEINHQGKVIGRLNFSERIIFFSLIQSDSELVERETLLHVAWPNKIVTSNSLNVAVKSIRNVFLGIGLDDVIITHVKKGFSWNRYYKVFLTESNLLEPLDASTTKRANLSEHFGLDSNDIIQLKDSINLNKDESNKNVNPYTLVSSKIDSIFNKINDSSIYYKIISILMWGGVIAHLFLDSNRNTLGSEVGVYQGISSCIVCDLSSWAFINANKPYVDGRNITKFEVKLVCDDFAFSNVVCINISSK